VTPARKRSSKKFPAQVQRAIEAAQDRKAVDVVVLDLRPADGFTDYFVIMTGANTRQIQAISDAIQDALGSTGVKPAHVEGGDRAGWILLDYFDSSCTSSAQTRARSTRSSGSGALPNGSTWLNRNLKDRDSGLGIRDWGLGIGDWATG